MRVQALPGGSKPQYVASNVKQEVELGLPAVFVLPHQTKAERNVDVLFNV
jgi:hypothetical protein